jgi:hypothetical protein
LCVKSPSMLRSCSAEWSSTWSLVMRQDSSVQTSTKLRKEQAGHMTWRISFRFRVPQFLGCRRYWGLSSS